MSEDDSLEYKQILLALYLRDKKYLIEEKAFKVVI